MRWVSLAFSFVLVLGVFGTLAVLQPESFNGYATEPTQDSLTIRTQTLVTAMTVASTAASVLAPTPTAPTPLDHDHSDHEDDDSTPVKNAAADFASLPLAQQSEIIQLSGRSGDEGKSYQVIEVKPGVVAVMANNGPQVVPVAVLNEDGTVSIHEY